MSTTTERQQTAIPAALSYGYRELCAVTGLARRSIERLIATGRFPRPRKSGRRTLFLADEVQAWLQSLPTRGD